MPKLGRPYNYLDIDRLPHVGETIVLPAGLRYVNEFFGLSSVSRHEHEVTVTDVSRDEVFWPDAKGRTCSARWRRKAA
jgi:hypothetical protein